MGTKTIEDVENNLFDDIAGNILSIDPIYFAENFLTIDGAPFKMRGNGYKPFVDIYRYIGLQSIRSNSRPIVLVKGRQIGMTTAAAALEMYFSTCGFFGNKKAPMRLIHLFPTLSLAAAFTKDKLNSMISASKEVPEKLRKDGTPKSFLESKLDLSSPSNNSQSFKRFLGGNQIWIESVGIDGDRIRGRQLCLETELPTPNGFVKLKDLKEGDQLFDENGNVCNVTKLHPINETPEAYRLTFDDGTTIDACAEHLWLTHTKRDRAHKRKDPPAIKNTKEILNTLKYCGERNHSIPNCLPINYPSKNLLVDPYLLGLWLGDGSRYANIETADPEVLNNFEHRVVPSSVGRIGLCFGVPRVSKSNAYRVIGLTTQLTKLGLIENPGATGRKNGRGFYHKHIPDEYMHSSFEQRLALLQGLMDSDGCCGTDGRCEFLQVEERKELAYQVLELIQSLGIKTTIVKRKSTRYGVQYQDKYRMQFYTTLPIFRLQRKLQNIKKSLTKSQKRFISNVEPIPSKPMRCITVDSPSHLYLITRSFIATHNTVDAAFYDEVQDMSVEAIGASTKILTRAKYGPSGKGLQVFFGTPKTKTGPYWEMWKKSTQNYFHLSCEKCNALFPIYKPGINWEDVWVYGAIVRCPECHHEQDRVQAIERGQWIALGDDPDNAPYIGYHFNQLLIPSFDGQTPATKEDIESSKPENSINTERIYTTEVLGEFFSGSSGLIELEEIHQKCADRDRRIAKAIHPGAKIQAFGGFDWGQKSAWDQLDAKGKQQGKSYSCGVILTVDKDNHNIFNVQFATRLKKNDMEDKISVVDEMFRRYSLTLCVGDIGDANDLTHKLQQKYDVKFLASRASHRITGHIKYSPDEFPKIITFERDYYISELIGLLKEGRIKFPYKSYDRIDWLVHHCTNIDIKITRDKAGEPIKKYVKAGPNDGLMSLLNAYLAWKFTVTNGFAIKSPQNMRYETGRSGGASDSAVLGYVPNMFGKSG